MPCGRNLGWICPPPDVSLANYEMGISELVPKVSCPDRFRVGVPYAVDSEERGEHREMTRHRIVEPREEAVHRVDPVVRIYKESREATAGS